MNFNPKDISNQIIYLLNNHPNPYHIRDKSARYLYMNLAMAELLNVPKGVPIEGKRLYEIKPELAGLFETLHQKEADIVQKQSAVSLLVTAHFGKETRLQPYIFDIYPFFNETGQILGTMTEARQCQFFSALDYIQGKSPKTLTNSLPNTILTQRELQIIFYFYHGFSKKELGKCLHLSHRTIDNKLEGIYEKMGVHNHEEFKKYIEERELNQFIPHHLLASNIQLIQ